MYQEAAINYYEHHLGDYARDTTHLTMLEHGAYRLLLDRYYIREEGIPQEQAHRVALARTPEEIAAVDSVLAEFFHLVDGVWINNKAEEEIEKARARIETARVNGRRGGRPKKTQKEPNDNPPETHWVNSGSVLETQTKAHQSPDTIHHKDNTCTKRSRVSYPPEFETFWVEYPTDPLMSKKKTFEAWKRLPEEDRAAARAAIPAFREHCRKNPDYRPVHAERFLSQRRFDGFNAGPKVGVDPDLARLQEIEAQARAQRNGGLNG